MCERRASNSAILAISHGSRCNDKATASYYSCPTFCDYNVSAAVGSDTLHVVYA
jgi:hypothetical protein